MPWNPDLYHQFEAARFAPFEDLAAMVAPRSGMRVIDLGCGTGELTRRLAERLPESSVLGIDNSAEMLEKANRHKREGLDFQPASIESVEGEWDLIFSNAAIHWADDHNALVPQLFSHLKPGGQMVIQVPSSHNHRAYVMIPAVASEEPFRTALQGWTRTTPVLEIEEYAELLFDCGGIKVTVFEKVYPHFLEDAGDLVKWTSGTILIPYLERLPAELRGMFLETYRARLEEIWPSGPIFFGFRRILFCATKPFK